MTRSSFPSGKSLGRGTRSPRCAAFATVRNNRILAASSTLVLYAPDTERLSKSSK